MNKVDSFRFRKMTSCFVEAALWTLCCEIESIKHVNRKDTTTMYRAGLNWNYLRLIFSVTQNADNIGGRTFTALQGIYIFPWCTQTTQAYVPCSREIVTQKVDAALNYYWDVIHLKQFIIQILRRQVHGSWNIQTSRFLSIFVQQSSRQV